MQETDEELTTLAVRLENGLSLIGDLRLASRCIRECIVMRKALRNISGLGGNMPDDRLTCKTGANDAVSRGLMYVEARRLAYEALLFGSDESECTARLRREAEGA